MLEGSNKMSLGKLINFTRITYTTFGIVFLVSGVLINLLQFLVYTFVKPFSKYLFRKCNYCLSYMMYSQIVFLLQYWADLNVILHGSKSDFQYFGKEHAVLLMNHSYEIDWMIGYTLCDGFSILGNVHTVAKKSIQYIPTVGYSWKIGGSIFVDRNWEKDEKTLVTKLPELFDQDNPLWIMLAAEGTRFSQEKLEVSNSFARKQGLPELRYHLTPRTKGFITSVQIIRNTMAALYNVNLGIKPGSVKPTLTNILLGKSIRVDVYVERFPIRDLPEKEADLAAWLHSTYKRKDDLIHSYITTGHWKAVSDPKEYVSVTLQRRIMPLVNFACWYISVLLPLGNFLIRLLMTGDFFSLATIVGIIGSFVYLLDRLVGETKISNASSYGSSKNF